MFTLHQEQQLDCSLETAWNFFSDPFNLDKITPKEMGFKVLNLSSRTPIHEGMLIDYHVAPILNIKLFWRTRIQSVENQVSFIDTQLKGPYKHWEHFHQFIPNEHGVLMKDTVQYALPMGFVGRLFHPLIRKKLDKIFSYRREILDKMFHNKSNN